MPKKHKFKSDALAAVHASAVALQKIGAIDQDTMRQLDDVCLAATLNQPENEHVGVGQCARI